MKYFAVILTVALALTACKNKDKTQTDTTTPTSTTGATTGTTKEITTLASIPAGYTLLPYLSKEPVRTFKTAPAMALQDGKDYYAQIDTNRGNVLVDLYEQETPVTVNNFVTLARNHFYDGIRFHRVIDGFMAQTGDPLSADETKKDQWGTGGPGYQFADEFRTKLTFNSSGILAMANSGAATNGSQIFITFGPTENLNGKHTIFGKVVKGDDVLPKLTRTMDQNNADVAGAVADKILAVRILTKN